ncbi:M48 family metallopeptidase [Campylobacter sp. RM13119]|uniref:M48 family metallopeptidase n=1 Tax=Campylobacter californiensis TaxID=1032243 RepID=UPI001474A463|nr:SprT family zinc-dependent metalloprotease [Campylobacter sp. RM13119]MBE3605395.1 M48 family metallopeptidase [Campylobacter sp. RM13119]
MAVKTACINFYNLQVKLNFKPRVKNTHLRVAKNAQISMTLPFRATQKQAIDFLEKNKEWLINTHERILKNMPKDGEFILLGKIYKIKFDEIYKIPVIDDNEILVKDKNLLEKFKKTRAKEIFSKAIMEFKPIINREVNRITVRNMQTRWGSCNSRKGYINLNINLIEKDEELIKYVVLHELTHLIYPHHQKSFYNFIERIMPDFRKREKRLNGKIV